MKILILDVDQAHNKKLEQVLEEDPKTIVVFCQNRDEAMMHLNANPDQEKKKKEMEKSLLDGGTLLTRTKDDISKIKPLLIGKKNEIAAVANPADKERLGKEVVELEGRLAKSEDLAKKLEAALEKRRKEVADLLATMPKEEEKKVHLVLIDRAFLGNIPSDWIADVRKNITYKENADVPIVTMGYNEDIEYIKLTLHGGVSDYFIKPVDTLLLKHNVSLISGQKSESDGKVYELQTKASIKILKVAMILKMSEFEIDLHTTSPFNEKEIVEFQADVFSGGEKGSKILGRCLKCAPDQAVKGAYISTFSFVGHTPHTMNEIRKWLRMQYINLKKAE